MPSGTSDVGFEAGFVAGLVVAGLAGVAVPVGGNGFVEGFAGAGSATATTGGFVVEVGGTAAVVVDPKVAVEAAAATDVGAPDGVDGTALATAVEAEGDSAVPVAAAAITGALAAPAVAPVAVNAAVGLEADDVEAGAVDGEDVAFSEPPRASQRPAPPNAAAPSVSTIQRDEAVVVGGVGLLSLE
jgi:hypothetical protein